MQERISEGFLFYFLNEAKCSLLNHVHHIKVHAEGTCTCISLNPAFRPADTPTSRWQLVKRTVLCLVTSFLYSKSV